MTSENKIFLSSVEDFTLKLHVFNCQFSSDKLYLDLSIKATAVVGEWSLSFKSFGSQC